MKCLIPPANLVVVAISNVIVLFIFLYSHHFHMASALGTARVDPSRFFVDVLFGSSKFSEVKHISDIMGEDHWAFVRSITPNGGKRQLFIDSAKAIYLCLRDNGGAPLSESTMKALRLKSSSKDLECRNLVQKLWLQSPNGWAMWPLVVPSLHFLMNDGRPSGGLSILIDESVKSCQDDDTKNSFDMMYLNALNAMADYSRSRLEGFSEPKYQQLMATVGKFKRVHGDKREADFCLGFARAHRIQNMKDLNEALHLWSSAEAWMRETLHHKHKETAFVPVLIRTVFTRCLVLSLGIARLKFMSEMDVVNMIQLNHLFEACEGWAGLSTEFPEVALEIAHWRRDYAVIREHSKESDSRTTDDWMIDFQVQLQKAAKGIPVSPDSFENIYDRALSSLPHSELNMNVAHACVCFGSQKLLFKFINSMENLNEAGLDAVADFCLSYGFRKKSEHFRRLGEANSKEDVFEQIVLEVTSNTHAHLGLRDHYHEAVSALYSLSYSSGAKQPGSNIPPAVVLREDLIPFSLMFGSQEQLSMVASALERKCTY